MALHEFIFGSNNNIEQDIEELLINFYKQQYLYFKKIGIGNETRYNTIVTQKLINTTSQRLDQLIRGKNSNNTLYLEKLAKGEIKSRITNLYSEEKSHTYIPDTSLQFSIKDMDISSQNIIDDSLEHSCYQEYIDNVTTAYRSEIMTAIIRHDN